MLTCVLKGTDLEAKCRNLFLEIVHSMT